MKPIAFAADAVLSRLLNKQNLYLKKIIFHWQDIVGEKLSEYVYPFKLQNDSDKKVLFLAVSNSAVSAEIHYIKGSIIEKITFFLGKQGVDEIKVLLKPVERK